MKARPPQNLAEAFTMFAGCSGFVGLVMVLQWRDGEPVSRNTAIVESLLLTGGIGSGVWLVVRRYRRKALGVNQD
jgi:hypothetical protein